VESSKLDPLALIRQQLALEGIALDSNERLARGPGPNAEEIPRLYVAWYPGGYVRYFRIDVPERIVARLSALPPEVLLSEPDRVKPMLAEDGPVLGVWSGRSYVVREPPPRTEFPDVTVLGERDRALVERFDPEMDRGQGVFAVVIGGLVASVCISARENESAAEAWVKTGLGYRRHGYARQTTAAWAHDAIRRGKTAFYSHAWDNQASRRVAESLSMTPFIDAVGYL
jgi:RimJ/RimL family protein N-acetyltransferase